jgi:hypothetical protein
MKSATKRGEGERYGASEVSVNPSRSAPVACQQPEPRVHEGRRTRPAAFKLLIRD